MYRTFRSIILAAVFLTACAHQERQVVRLQPGETVNIQNFDMKKQSLVIELREGEVIPLDVIVEGDYFATASGASVPVTVKKTCFMRVDDRGLRVSEDGVNFDEKPRVPGSFQLGVGMTKDSGKKATLRLTMTTDDGVAQPNVRLVVAGELRGSGRQRLGTSLARARAGSGGQAASRNHGRKAACRSRSANSRVIATCVVRSTTCSAQT